MKLVISIVCLLLLHSSTCLYAQEARSGVATIKVRYSDTNPNDTLLLLYYPHEIYNVPRQNGDFIELKSHKGNDSLFNFKFPVTPQSGYFFVAKQISPADPIYKELPSLKFRQLTIMLLPEAGDSILINVTDSPFYYGGAFKCTYSGVGWRKYELREQILFDDGSDSIFVSPLNDNNAYIPENHPVKFSNDRLMLLQQRKEQLSDNAYNILKADLIFRNDGLRALVEWRFQRLPDTISLPDREILKERFKRSYQFLRKEGSYGIPETALVKSISYAPYMLEQIYLDCIVYGRPLSSIYDSIKKSFTGPIRDKLLTTYFLMSNYPRDYAKLKDAIETIKFQPYKQKTFELYNTIGKTNAYNFKLRSVNGDFVSFDSLAGKVVFIDFWFTGCAACSNFYSSTLSKIEEEFRPNPKVAFVSISVDRDSAIWKKSIKTNKYTSEDVINLFTNGNGTNDAVIKHYNILGYPTSILIGKFGNIIKIYNEGKSPTYECIKMHIEKALL